MSDRPPDLGAPGASGATAAKPTSWVLLLLAAIGAIGLVGIIGIAIMFSSFGGSYEPPKVAAKNDKLSFIVRGGEQLAGTNWIKMTVAASTGDGDPYGVSSRSGGEDIRNILLVDKASGASRRLLPDNLHRILDSDFLSAKAELMAPGRAEDLLMPSDSATATPDERKAPIAYYLLRIERPGKDGTATTSDLLAGVLASGRQAYVMRAVDGVDMIWMRSPTQIGLMVREKLGLYFRVVDIPSLKMVESRRIEID